MQITDVPPIGNYQIVTIMTEAFLIAAIIGTLLYIMNRRSKSFQAINPKSMKLSTTRIALILLMIAILGPAYLNVYPRTGFYPSMAVFAMSWQMQDFVTSILFFGPDFLLVAALLMFLKFVFVYQIFKYYYRATTKNRVIAIGVISELQLTILGLAVIPLTFRTPGLSIMLSIPIPVLLLTGLLMLKFVPVPPLLGDWGELEKPKEWWNEIKG
jgi:hypothetical protein